MTSIQLTRTNLMPFNHFFHPIHTHILSFKNSIYKIKTKKTRKRLSTDHGPLPFPSATPPPFVPPLQPPLFPLPPLDPPTASCTDPPSGILTTPLTGSLAPATPTSPTITLKLPMPPFPINFRSRSRLLPCTNNHEFASRYSPGPHGYSHDVTLKTSSA